MVQATVTEQVLQSSQSFIRALKSSADPLDGNGPTKIQIARMGWDSDTLYVPRKAGLILEWIFTRFHKERSRRGHENPLLDVDHWSLLADIIASPGDTQIEPIIQRASIPVLIASFIPLYPTVPTDTRHLLLGPLLGALSILWPLAMQRVGLDPLSECLWPSLTVTDQFNSDTGNDGFVDILTLVLTGFRAAHANANAAGRKKAYTAISQHQFIPWLRALHFVPPTHYLHRLLYLVGTDILYNPDSLRTVIESNPHAKSNSDLFSTLFGPSTADDVTVQHSLLRILPSLYKDYVVALHKQRSSLFLGTPAGLQTRDRILHAASRFGDECLAYLMIIEGEELQESTWKTILDVLRVTEKDAMFHLTENDPYIVRMEQVGEAAFGLLDRPWDDSHSSVATHALDVYSCLQRMQPELSIKFLPRLLERLVTASPALDRPVMTLLNELTSYHSKTRTLHTFISHLLAALTPSPPFFSSSDIQATYIKCTYSSLLSLPFLDEITNALRIFVTPGQADHIEQSVKEALESFLRLRVTSQEPERKRRKLSSKDQRTLLAGGIGDSGPDVIKLALVARLGAPVLRTILHTRTGKDAVERERACLSSLDEPISDALRTLFRAESGPGDAIVKNRGKRSRREQIEGFQWTHQCLCSAVIRLWYELFAERAMACRNLETDVNWVVTATLDNLGDTFKRCMREETFPELQFEIGRVMFALRAINTQQSHQFIRTEWPAFDIIFGYIQANLITSSVHSKTHCSQSPYSTKPLAALALWSLILERYLPTIDLHASEQQLDRLVAFMIRVQVELPSTGQDQPRSAASTLQRALASASFWEFGNLRTAMLSALDKQTSVLGSVDTQKLLSSFDAGTRSFLDSLSKLDNVSLADIEAVVGVYRLLHHFPPEYLSRTSRADLATRALNADILVRAFNHNEVLTSQGQFEWRAVFRSFVVKIARQFQLKLVEDVASSLGWLSYLTLSNDGPAKPSLTSIQATLELLLLVQISATRGAVKTEGRLLINVITHFLECNPYSNWDANSQLLVHKSLLQFFEVLDRECRISSLEKSVLLPLQQLCTSLESSLGSAIRMVTDQSDSIDFLASEYIIEAWQALLSLKHRFSMKPPVESFGQKLLVNTMRIMRSGTSEIHLVSDKFCATILYLLVTEGSFLPEHDCRAVLSVMAAYLFFTTSRMHVEETACDITISRASKSFSVTQYKSALELIAEALQEGPDDQQQFIALINLSTLLLRGAPERTYKLAHEHLAQCLQIFITRPAFMDSSSTLALKALDFTQSQCMERAASLNSLDVACMLSIISKLSLGSSKHDESSSFSTFQAMISILNSLVRLRRDLLGPLLPQLSMVLRQMILNVRGVRPLLGSKQYRFVADTFPKWINPIDPLGEVEARSLSRLLTAFTTKSIVRSHAGDTQKADSLARPFARHAPYVLLSYLQLMNDPLSVLSAGMRHELEPGLFALCAMMGENGRDTLMVQSLDIGGKAMLKSLWKEYDRQRYIGRG